MQMITIKATGLMRIMGLEHNTQNFGQLHIRQKDGSLFKTVA